jgi:hypothetical protein
VFGTDQVGVVADDIPEEIQQYVVNSSGKHEDHVATRTKFSNNLAWLAGQTGMTGINCTIPYENTQGWVAENTTALRNANIMGITGLQNTPEYKRAVIIDSLDWSFEMFDNFKTVDYSRLATMSALAACQKQSKAKTECRIFEDFFEYPVARFSGEGVTGILAVGGQILIGGFIKSNFVVQPSTGFEMEARIKGAAHLGAGKDAIQFYVKDEKWIAQVGQNEIDTEIGVTGWQLLKICVCPGKQCFYIGGKQMATFKLDNSDELLNVFISSESCKVDYVGVTINREE